jgi:hypothetical protein
MFRTAFVVAALSVSLLWVGAARAQTPWGGDDTGFIPPPAAAKCEAGAAKAWGKLIACISKCHTSRAIGKLADDTSEDSCEKTLVGKSCVAKFAASIAKLTGCPSCINGTTMANLAGLTENLLDGNNSMIYCDTSSGTPFGGDDTGDIPPPGSAIEKCEVQKIAKAAANLAACQWKCHKKRASGTLADETAEEGCELPVGASAASCTHTFFRTVIPHSAGCASCTAGNRQPLANLIHSMIDGNNGTVYCASPSGAFVR